MRKFVNKDGIVTYGIYANIVNYISLCVVFIEWKIDNIRKSKLLGIKIAIMILRKKRIEFLNSYFEKVSVVGISNTDFWA